jgi:hypothetical protein
MSTWGQLRFLLQNGAPGVSVDLIDGYLNSRYEQVLGAHDWMGLNAPATLQTTAAYLSANNSDSVNLTVGSNAVVGVGTTWTSTITGLKFFRPGDTAIYTVTYITGTSATLDRAYEGVGWETPGTAYAAADYVLMQNVYALPADCSAAVTILDPVTLSPLNSFSKAQLDECAGTRAMVGQPASYAVCDDTPEAAPPVLHQVELYPPPLTARGYPLEYDRAAFGWDGQSTGNSPLPFVTDTVMLEGVRADIAAHLAAAAQGAAVGAMLTLAKLHEAKFQEEVRRLIGKELKQRKKKVPMQMAGRFTRHRMARSLRGWSNGWRGGGQGGPN